MFSNVLAILFALLVMRWMLLSFAGAFGLNRLMGNFIPRWMVPSIKPSKLKKPAKGLYRFAWGNQYHRRGFTFALFHLSMICTVVSALLYYQYTTNWRYIAGFFGATLLFGGLYKWRRKVKGKAKHLPGRRRR